VHKQEIFIVCFLNFFCIFQSLKDTKRSRANISENLLQLRADIRNFLSFPNFAESANHSWTLSWKCGVKCSIVFVTVFSDRFERFRQKRGVKLRIFGESTELNLLLFAKMRNKILCFRQYTVYSEKKWNYAFSPNMWSETKHFRRKHRLKQCVFCNNVVFVKILLCTRILHLIKIFWEILDLSLVYYWMMPKRCGKLTTKSRACVPLRRCGVITVQSFGSHVPPTAIRIRVKMNNLGNFFLATNHIEKYGEFSVTCLFSATNAFLYKYCRNSMYCAL
jgi:hypothetical protein